MKQILSKLATRLMMVALALTTVFTFIACGGGDDEETDIGGISGNTHRLNVIEGKWYDGDRYYYFDGSGGGSFHYGPDVTDMSCWITYHVQGNGNWGTVFIKAKYQNYTTHSIWSDEFYGSYNLKDGKMTLRSIVYRKK